LTALVLLAVAANAALNRFRDDLLRRCSLDFERALSPAVLALSERPAHGPRRPEPTSARSFDDLDHLRAFIAGPAMVALLDAPGTPLVLGICFLLHPWIGIMVLVMGAVVTGLTWLAERLGRRSRLRAAGSMRRTEALRAADFSRDEVSVAMGMDRQAASRWRAQHAQTLTLDWRRERQRSAPETALRVVREMSAPLAIGLGAVLVAQDQMTAGALFAASLLVAKAMQPIQALIAHAPAILRAREAWTALDRALRRHAMNPSLSVPQRPSGELAVSQLALQPPDQPRERWLATGLSFVVPAGGVLAVIGQSGSGKTALLRTLAGAWPAPFGDMRLGGQALTADRGVDRAGVIGYANAEAVLVDGTIAENIARLGEASLDQIRRAARQAGVDAAILALPLGYDHPIVAPGAELPRTLRHGIALARALLHDPPLLLLDDPWPGLDAPSEERLATALAERRSQGLITVFTTHKIAQVALATHLLVLGQGGMRAFGPRDEIVRHLAQPRLTTLKAVGA
jgi:ABC-type protease/lipase transport system fused ATPase/permease subunit